MRASYHEALNSVITDLVKMTDLVTEALRGATIALLDADLGKAEKVIADDANLDALHDDLEVRCFSLLARQAPVAGELRIVVAALRMIADLARMGDLSAHVAKIARMRYPAHAVPEALNENFANMAKIAEDMVITAGRTLKESDVDDAHKMADNDEIMDRLRTEQFQVMLGDDWPYGVQAAIDCALLGRYYERIADHAVLMGSRVIYLATGQVPEGENWTIA